MCLWMTIRLYMNIFFNAFHYNKNINNNINCRLMSQAMLQNINRSYHATLTTYRGKICESISYIATK